MLNLRLANHTLNRLLSGHVKPKRNSHKCSRKPNQRTDFHMKTSYGGLTVLVLWLNGCSHNNAGWYKDVNLHIVAGHLRQTGWNNDKEIPPQTHIYTQRSTSCTIHLHTQTSTQAHCQHPSPQTYIPRLRTHLPSPHPVPEPQCVLRQVLWLLPCYPLSHSGHGGAV